jgi:hypothetical protein
MVSGSLFIADSPLLTDDEYQETEKREYICNDEKTGPIVLKDLSDEMRKELESLETGDKIQAEVKKETSAVIPDESPAKNVQLISKSELSDKDLQAIKSLEELGWKIIMTSE